MIRKYTGVVYLATLIYPSHILDGYKYIGVTKSGKSTCYSNDVKALIERRMWQHLNSRKPTYFEKVYQKFNKHFFVRPYRVLTSENERELSIQLAYLETYYINELKCKLNTQKISHYEKRR